MAIKHVRIARWIPKATNTNTLRLYKTHCFLFNSNDDCTNAPYYYVMRSLPLLFAFLTFSTVDDPAKIITAAVT
jgi:hypothetical protein